MKASLYARMQYITPQNLPGGCGPLHRRSMTSRLVYNEGKRYLHPDDRGRLEQALLGGWQAVEAGGKDAVHGGGDVELYASLQCIAVVPQCEQFLILQGTQEPPPRKTASPRCGRGSTP